MTVVYGCVPVVPELPKSSPIPQPGSCRVKSPGAKPYLVELDPAERIAIETRAKTSMVVVRYDGCNLDVLSDCQLPGQYSYTASQVKRHVEDIESSDRLWATVPFAAGKVEATLKSAGGLRLSTALVGRYDADKRSAYSDELRGEAGCRGATHIITGWTVGAFELYHAARNDAGAGAEVGGTGAGAEGTHRHVLRKSDGTLGACEAKQDAGEPPEGCRAAVRVTLARLTRRAAAHTASPTGSLPAGEQTSAGSAPPPPGQRRRPEARAGDQPMGAGESPGYGVRDGAAQQEADQAGAPSPLRTAMLIGGGGLMAVGLGSLAYSASLKSSSTEDCIDGVCPESAEADYEKGRTLAHVATGTLLLGGALLGGGVLWLALDADDQEDAAQQSPQVQHRSTASAYGIWLRLGLGSANLQGRW